MLSHTPIDVVGLVAGCFTTFAAVPQLILVVRTKTASNLSYGTLIMGNIGVLLWMVYGCLLHNIPLATWNSISSAINLSLLGAKVYLDKNQRSNQVDGIQLVCIEA